MKKVLTSLLCVCICVVLCSCGYSNKYNEAKNALDSNDYNTAISILGELADNEYKDSSELLKEAKYQYLESNLDRENSRSVTYLNELKDENYKDTQQLYDQLYSWKAEIAVSRTQRSSVHMSDLDITSQLFPIYFLNFRIYDGPPDGEYTGTYEVIFSDGQKISDTYIGRDNDFYYSVTLSSKQNSLGNTTFNIYGENGELLASETSYIH